MNKYFFVTISGLALACGQASAQFYVSGKEPLQPRIEAGGKVGTERSIGSMEGWMPLAQDNDSVLYADIRWTADDGDNREGNLGLGYRKIVADKMAGGDAIIGGHGWIDRRRTDRGSTFHQVTAGAEYLKEDWDVKANAYIPLNKDKEYFTPNIGSSTPYLAGTGIFVDTAGYIVEEAQPGGDVEVGYRLPVLESKLDAVRVYGGGYAFIGDQTDDVIGGRVRASVDVNPLVNVGARFQYDEPRGSQGFLEATLRFPFSAKKRFQTSKLRARLDESPERDIDIVTGSKVDNGLRKEVVNAASGQTQRVIHVDNTAATGGDGSRENPFNTLAAAQAAMLDNDVIYVHAGNGTSSGMNQGITINKSNVQLIGSGTDFVFDTGKFTTRRPGQPINGTVIVAGGAVAPVITNSIVPVDINDIYTGHGILVTRENAKIAGIDISNAAANGIYVLSDNGNIVNNVLVSDVTSTGNNGRGVLVGARSGGSVNNITLEGVNSNGNQTTSGRGIEIQADGVNSTVNGVSLKDVSVSANTRQGFMIYALNAGEIDHISIDQAESKTNTAYGAMVYANSSGQINNVTVNDLLTENNAGQGLSLYASGTGKIDNTDLINITSRNNTGASGRGIEILSEVNGSAITNITGSNFTLTGNSQQGLQVSAITSGLIDNLSLSQVTAEQNNATGIFIQTSSAGKINNTSVEKIASNFNIGGNTHGMEIRSNGSNSEINNIIVDEITSTSNSQRGIIFYALNGGNLAASLSNSNVLNNSAYGVFVDDDTTGTFNVDMGGGSLGSIGNNRFFGNSSADLRIDLDNSGMSSQHNWWGQSGGPLGGQIANEGACPSCGTVDSTNALNSDPRV